MHGVTGSWSRCRLCHCAHPSHMLPCTRMERMLQNADDNAYQHGGRPPALEFLLLPGRLAVLNNEAGFRAADVRALSDVGASTKSALAAGGGGTGCSAGSEGKASSSSSGSGKGAGGGGRFIGNKGIGFKSVFRVTDAPQVSELAPIVLCVCVGWKIGRTALQAMAVFLQLAQQHEPCPRLLCIRVRLGRQHCPMWRAHLPLLAGTPLTPSTPLTPLTPLTPFDLLTPLTPLTPLAFLTPLTPLSPVTPFPPLTPVSPVSPFTPLNPCCRSTLAASTSSLTGQQTPRWGSFCLPGWMRRGRLPCVRAWKEGGARGGRQRAAGSMSSLR